jgi:MGT family glycosyltransferase
MERRRIMTSARHIAFFPLPATGHVYPNLAVAAELVRRGHRVSFAATEKYRAAVESTGARLVVCRPALWKPPRGGGEPPVYARRRHAVVDARWALPQLTAGLGDDPPDVALCDPIAFGGQLFAAARGIPIVHTCAAFVSNRHWSIERDVGGFAPDGPAQRAFRAELAALFPAYGVRITAARFLAEAESLDEAGRTQVVYLPRAFQHRGETFGPRFHFVGPCPRARQPAVGWRRPADDGPVALVTLGTVDNRNPAFFRTCLAAFAGTPWRVELVVGERLDPAGLGQAPPNVRIHRTVPQLDVLDCADVFVSHGGMGGVLEAIVAGVPQVVVPQTLEQDVNGRRVAELGLGVRLPGGAHRSEGALTGPDLRKAIEQLSEPAIAERITAMRAEIRAAGGAARAADVVLSVVAA